MAEMKGMLDYRETGGTLLLGITRPVVKAHGSSDRLAMFHSIRQAAEAVDAGVAQDLSQNIDKMTVPKELDYVSGT